jgi:hypothetical protein
VEESPIEAIFIFFSCFTLWFFFGYLITFKGRRGLISGYSENDFYHPQAFGENIGLSLIFFSGLTVFIACFWYLGGFTENKMSSYVLCLVIGVVLNYIYGIVKYRKKGN